MDPLLPVVIGGVIGVAGGVISPLLLEIWKRKTERENLTGAFISEINALLQIVERRKYVEELESLISQAKSGIDRNAIYFYQFSVRRNPFPVYEANLSKIGILKNPLPQKIAQFYARSSSILEDIADMRDRKNIPQSSKESIDKLKTLVQLCKDTISLGLEIVRFQKG